MTCRGRFLVAVRTTPDHGGPPRATADNREPVDPRRTPASAHTRTRKRRNPMHGFGLIFVLLQMMKNTFEPLFSGTIFFIFADL
jgi:hypothetical protein